VAKPGLKISDERPSTCGRSFIIDRAFSRTYFQPLRAPNGLIQTVTPPERLVFRSSAGMFPGILGSPFGDAWMISGIDPSPGLGIC